MKKVRYVVEPTVIYMIQRLFHLQDIKKNPAISRVK